MSGLRITILLALATLVAACGAFAQAPGTGLRAPTAEERLWDSAHVKETIRVRMNEIGLKRVNAERKAKGLPPLNELPVPHGQESVTLGAPTVGAVPAAVDNTALPSFPPMRSQGSLNSCAAFSSTYFTMTHMVGLARGWNTKSTTDNSNKFSPKFTYNMINNGQDAGAWITTAFNVMLKHGCPTWADFAYVGSASNTANYREWPTTASLWRGALNYRMDQTGKVTGVDTNTGLANLKALLADGYVLNYGTNIYCWQYTTLKNDPATTADDAFVGKRVAHMVNTSRNDDGHGMTVVGYNDNVWTDINGNGAVDAGEKGAVRIANSWGTSWEDGGFVWVAYDALKTTSAVSGVSSANRRGAFWYNEAYWITARANYAPTMLAQFTVNHASRNQLRMSVGTSATTATTPSSTWTGTAINYQGGAYAMDGTAVFDLSDLAPADGSLKRWYVGMQDKTAGSAGTLTDFTLVDGRTGATKVSATVPKTADGSTAYAYVDYAANSVPPPPTPLTRVTLAAAPASPRMPGTPITLTATADGTNTEYQFRLATLLNGAYQWSTLQAYGTVNTCVWTPAAGKYVLMVWARTAGSTAQYQVYSAQIPYSIAAPAITAVTLTGTPGTPVSVGTPVTFTAASTGGQAEYSYRVAIYNGVSWTWTTLRGYTSDPQFTWNTAQPGRYVMMVWARAQGSTASYQAYAQVPYTVQ